MASSERLATEKPSPLAMCITSTNRSACRGAITSSACGAVVLIRRKARSTGSSSPRIVLPATTTGRCGASRKKRSTRSRGRPCAGTTGRRAASNFRLPVTVTREASAPMAMIRLAASSLCMQKTSMSARTARKNGRMSRYRGNDRADTRPLTMAVFTSRRRHSARTLGQISPSIRMSRRGRTRSSTRRTTCAKSIGK